MTDEQIIKALECYKIGNRIFRMIEDIEKEMTEVQE